MVSNFYLIDGLFFVCVNVIYAKHIKYVSCCICERINAQGTNMKPHVTLVNPQYQKGVHQYLPFTQLGLGVGVMSAIFKSKSVLATMKMAEEESNRLTIPAVVANLV